MGKVLVEKINTTTILFLIMLIPISSSAGLSINYLFFLYPFLYLFIYRKFSLPKKNVLRIFFLYVLIFCVGFPFVPIIFPGFTFRSITSFLIFISIFSFSFIPKQKLDIVGFKIAVIIISVYFSLESFFSFILFRDLGVFDLKGEIGSQRFGFVYLLAISILVFSKDIFLKFTLLKNFLIFIILVGLLLTFSRTPIIALTLTTIIYTLLNFKLRRFLTLKFYKDIVIFIFIISLISSIIYFYFYDLLTFFDNRIITNIFKNENISADISNSDTSEGTRLVIWNSIFNFTLHHPITGSSYLGAFIMEASNIDLFNKGKYFMDSSHNQYMDTMLRTGFIGFIAYIILIFKILVFLYKNDQSLFYGFLSIVVYGFFHETFKLSQGAFIFSFLIAVYSKDVKYSRIND